MGLDNGAGDRQPHADAVRLGREHGLEYPVHNAGLEAVARVFDGDHHLARAMEFGSYRQHAFAIVRRHRFNCVCYQVHQHLLELDRFALYAWQAFAEAGLNQDPMRQQFIANDGESFLNGTVDIKRSSRPGAHPEMRPDVVDQDVRALSVGQDAPQRVSDVVQVRLDAIKPVQSGACTGDDRRQRLLDLVDDGSRHDVAGHQSRLALMTLYQKRAEQLLIKRRYLVQQEEEHEKAGDEPEGPAGVPAGAEAGETGKRNQIDLDRIRTDNDHQPQIEHRTPAQPEKNECKAIPDDQAAGEVKPERREVHRIDRD